MNKYFILLGIILFTISSCTKEGGGLGASSSSSSSSSGNGTGGNSGIITAGEWNDLDHWQFWLDLQSEDEINELADHWKMFTNNRISVIVKNGLENIPNAIVELKKNNSLLWTARTDCHGKAELWIGFSALENIATLSEYQLFINGSLATTDVKLFQNAPIEIQSTNTPLVNSIEIGFVVDATGSMGDEIEFLQHDLKDVLQRVKNNNPTVNLKTATVFYRDEKDEYLTRKSAFTNNINSTISFIDQQSAGGGGDYPEAVHSGLHEAINNLQWTENGKTKIVFLILDAPPHHEAYVINKLVQNTKLAAKKGIKIIPITASGINKETEFLMRYLAMTTNGTYVFITNDSGVGNNHIEATVGSYNVEYLNDLMVRLITKYSE